MYSLLVLCHGLSKKCDWQCVIHSGKIPENWLSYHISVFLLFCFVFFFSSKLRLSETHIHENSGETHLRIKRLIATCIQCVRKGWNISYFYQPFYLCLVPKFPQLINSQVYLYLSIINARIKQRGLLGLLKLSQLILGICLPRFEPRTSIIKHFIKEKRMQLSLLLLTVRVQLNYSIA